MYNIYNERLREEINALLADIDSQIEAIKKVAENQGLDVYDMRLAQGEWPLKDLFVAKATCIQTLVILETSH